MNFHLITGHPVPESAVHALRPHVRDTNLSLGPPVSQSMLTIEQNQRKKHEKRFIIHRLGFDKFYE